MSGGDTQTLKCEYSDFLQWNEEYLVFSGGTTGVTLWRIKTEWKVGHTHFPLGYLVRTTEISVL